MEIFMKGRGRILLLSVLLAVFFAGSFGLRMRADGTDSSALRTERIVRDTVTTVPGLGYSSNTSRPKFRTMAIGGFSGSFGLQLPAGSLERKAYDEMVRYFVTEGKTGSIEVACSFAFAGSGKDWEKSDEYEAAREEIAYAMTSAGSAFVYDYPELFWIAEMQFVENSTVSVVYDGDVALSFSGAIEKITIGFTEIYQGAKSRQGAFGEAVDNAVAAVRSRRMDATQYQTVKAIHDYVCEALVYPYAYNSANPSTDMASYHSAGAAFLDSGVAVCDGYSKAFMVLCRKFDIPTILIAGEADEDHMWNYVQIQGKWYAVDTVWDDRVGASTGYTYFMIGSETPVPGGTFGTTRVLNTRLSASDNSKNFDYPILNGTSYEGEGTEVHNWVVMSETSPTCTEQGRIVYRCSTCGALSTSVISALGHSYHEQKYVYNNDATVLRDGTKSLVCDNGCGTKKKTVTAVGTRITPAIKVNVSKLVLKTGQSTGALQVSGLVKGDSILRWESLNTKLVKVSSTGKITAQKKTGSTKIRIVLSSGLTKTVKVTVQKKAVATTKISGIAKSITLKKGKSQKLTPVLSPITSVQKITYKSSNKKVVSVSSSGKITAKKKGKATITVKSGKKSFKCKVTVK